MNLKIDQSFDRDLSKIKDKSIHKKVALCIEQVRGCSKVSDIKNIKDLKTHKAHYRIKIGIYRIGLKIEKDALMFICFIRILHRKDIYKYFPK